MKLYLVTLMVLGQFLLYAQNACQNFFYGVSHRGGTFDNGLIFKSNSDGSVNATVYEFNSIADGIHPVGRLLNQGDTLLYGACRSGGNFGGGVLFSYNKKTANYTVLHHFEKSTGERPYGGIYIVSNKIFGTTYSGGADRFGVLYEFDLVQNSYTVLEEFNGSGKGSRPFGGLIMVNNKLYGTTYFGGANDLGTIFEFDLSNSSFSKKVDFSTTSGGSPKCGLTSASNGNLYGVCSAGGTNDFGTIFQYVPGATSVTKYYDFNWLSSGGYPKSSLMEATDGSLYGLTSDGGGGGNGTIFRFQPGANTFSTLYHFETSTGKVGTSQLVEDNGLLYGTSSAGGIGKSGTLFSYDYIADSCVRIKEFSGVEGEFLNTGLTSVIEGSEYNHAISICEGDVYSFGNQNLDTDGSYIQTFSSVGGCDSIVNLNLSVNLIDSTFDTIIISDGNPVSVHGNMVSTNGEYVQTYTSAITNCDSVSTVIVSNTTGLSEQIDLEDVEIYPNPSHGLINLKLPENHDNAEVRIFDFQGRLFYKTRVYNGFKSVNVEALQSGTYLIVIENEAYHGVFRVQIIGE